MENDNMQLHKYPLEFILITSFSFKHSAGRNFNLTAVVQKQKQHNYNLNN